jgi:hypothetical protein
MSHPLTSFGDQVVGSGGGHVAPRVRVHVVRLRGRGLHVRVPGWLARVCLVARRVPRPRRLAVRTRQARPRRARTARPALTMRRYRRRRSRRVRRPGRPGKVARERGKTAPLCYPGTARATRRRLQPTPLGVPGQRHRSMSGPEPDARERANQRLREAKTAWGQALSAHKLAPPDAGFAARLCSLAGASEDEREACQEAGRAGLLWRPIPGAQAPSRRVNSDLEPDGGVPPSCGTGLTGRCRTSITRSTDQRRGRRPRLRGAGLSLTSRIYRASFVSAAPGAGAR